MRFETIHVSLIRRGADPKNTDVIGLLHKTVRRRLNVVVRNNRHQSMFSTVCLLRAHGGSSRVLVERMTSRAERSGNGTLAGWARLKAGSGRPYGAYHSD